MILKNKTLQLYKNQEGHLDEDNIWAEGGLEYKKSIDADAQPYSSEMLKRQYGYEIQLTKRIFVDLDEDITLGSVLKLDVNEAYEVKKIITWDDYLELMCTDCEVPQ